MTEEYQRYFCIGHGNDGFIHSLVEVDPGIDDPRGLIMFKLKPGQQTIDVHWEHSGRPKPPKDALFD